MMSTALPSPRFTDPRDAPVLRWGILAPGAIANDFVDSLVRHTDQRVVAAGSRTLERAQEFARKHGIDRAYGSYGELVADPEVDVVYIASPHSLHEEHAMLAIAAGKHVLIEKPIAPTAAAARRIVEAARAAGVFAMEAMWTRYRPQSDVIRQTVENGLLGELRIVTADFGGAAAFDPASRIFDPRLAGGALLDLGVYVAAWATFILGTELEVTARGRLAPTGVDAHAALILSSAGGAHALLSAGVDAATPVRSVIAGERGRLEVSSPFWDADTITFYDADGTLVDEWADTFDRPARQSLCYQAAALARYVDAGLTESPLHGLDETIRVLEMLDDARRQIGGAEPGDPA
ncbi:Gfo/Idh/MocA family oxidoreductase [Labedella endophytica]